MKIIFSYQIESPDNFAVPKTILIGLLAAFVIFSGVNAFLLSDVSNYITGKVLETKELQRPANLEVVKLVPENCADCFNIERIVADLKSKNVNITSEKTILASESEAKQFIEAYGLETLPALVIAGEINKSESLQNFFNSVGKIDGEVALYTKIEPPFFDLKENSIKGRVKVISIVDSGCANCTNFEGFVDYLRQNGVSISESKEVKWNSADGKELLKKFGLTKAPGLLVSEDISEYKAIPALMKSQLNATISGGWFAMSAFKAPYREVNSGKIAGLAELILLKDSSCLECYDVSLNKNILARFGIVFGSEKEIDVSSAEGKALVEKYKIKKAPIIIISPDGKYYEEFVSAWTSSAQNQPAVGSIESDGWYVMRTPEIIGPVRDLETGKVVMPQQEEDMAGHHG